MTSAIDVKQEPRGTYWKNVDWEGRGWKLRKLAFYIVCAKIEGIGLSS